MRILILHQYFLGEGEPGGSRFNEFSRIWADAGHDVTVLAGTVNYTTGRTHDRYKGRLVTSETAPGGVRVLRCHVSEAYQRGLGGRLLGYASFGLSSTLAGLFQRRPDVVLATSPPLFIGPPGAILAARHRVPFVFEVRDLWPDSMIDTAGMPGRSIQAAFAIEAWTYSRASAINVLTPAFRRVLIEKKGIDPKKIWLVPNGADLDTFAPGDRNNWFRKKIGVENEIVALYAGAHGPVNCLDQLLDAAHLLRDRRDIRIVLVGDGMHKAKLRERAREMGLPNVMFVDAQPKEKMPDVVRAADICIAVLKRAESMKTVYPNKVFDFMACGRPVLLAIDGVARELVEEAGAGVFAEPENPAAIASALLKLAASPEERAAMGKRGRSHVVEHFSRATLAQRYERHLNELVKRK